MLRKLLLGSVGLAMSAVGVGCEVYAEPPGVYVGGPTFAYDPFYYGGYGYRYGYGGYYRPYGYYRGGYAYRSGFRGGGGFHGGGFHR